MIRTCQEGHDSLIGCATTPLVLRVRSGEHEGKVLRLSAAKCTIGSHPNATLRLRAPGIYPVHCLILRGEQGTYIRSWAPQTHLNNARFDLRPLQNGDQLDIGFLELEVLESSPERLADEPSKAVPDASEMAPPNAGFASAGQRELIDRLEHDLANTEQLLKQLQQERADLDEAVASAARRADEAEQRCADQEANLQERLRDAEEAILTYESRVEELNDELALSQLRLSDWQRESEQRLSEAAESKQRLQSQLDQLATEQQPSPPEDTVSEDTARQLASLQARIKDLEAALSASEQQLTESREHAEQAEQTARDLEAAREAHAAASQDVQRLSDESASLQARIKDLEAALSASQQQLTESRERAEQAEQTARDLEAAREAHATASQDVQRLSDESASLQARIKDLEAALSASEQQLTESRERAEQAEQTARDLEAARETQAVAENDGNADAHAELVSLQSRVTELEAELSDHQERLATSRQKLEEAERAVGELENELRAQQEATQRLTQELEHTRDEHREARNEWHLDRENLQRELADRSEGLQRQKAQHQELMDEAEDLIRSLQHEGKQLLAQLSEAKQTIRQNAEERQELEEAMRSHEKCGASVEYSRRSPISDDGTAADGESESSPGSPISATLPMGEGASIGLEVISELDASTATESLDVAQVESHDAAEQPHGIDCVVSDEPAVESATEQEVPVPAEPGLHNVKNVDDLDPEDHDGFVQDYIQRLLGRSNTEVTAGNASRQATQSTRASNATAEAPQPAGDVPVAAGDQPGAEQPAKPARAAGRAGDQALSATEKSNLGAMRELANSSARTALDISQRRRNLTAAAGQAVLAITCVSSGITTLVMSDGATSLFGIGGMVGVVFGLTRAARAVRFFRRKV
jgi:chromosome segregation ATPase